MSIADTIRAWRNRAFRESLSEEERAKLLENPVGLIELNDEDLLEVVGSAQSGASSGCNTKTCTSPCFTSNCRGNSRQPCM
jgi:type 2 lantibiotic, mersacidin/lichenicidin family